MRRIINATKGTKNYVRTRANIMVGLELTYQQRNGLTVDNKLRSEQ